MSLSKLFELGEKILELQKQLTAANKHHPTAAHTMVLQQQAAKLVHEYMPLVDPTRLLPAIRALGQDAARYQFLRNEADSAQWAMACACKAQETDAFLDGLIEEAMVKDSADQLILALNTGEGNG